MVYLEIDSYKTMVEKKVLNFLRSLSPFSDKSWKLLQPALKEARFKKGDFLLKQGEICNSLFYIVDGYCKSYYEIDGEIKNTGFFMENEITTNVQSFGTEKKSEYNIIACESLTAVVFAKEKLFDIAQQSSEIEALGRICIRLFAIKQEELSSIFQLYSAEQRLEYLENTRPEIMQRVPLSQIASFLGVKRETLSRIRNRRTLR